MNTTKIKTILAIAGAVMTAASVTGITVTLARQADPADPAPVATAPDLRDGAEAQAAPEAVPTPDLAGAREAAELSMRRFYAGDFGGHWDTWDSQAQEIISREDYVTRMEQCRPVAVGLTPEFGEFRMEGATEVRFSFELFGFTFGERMVWEEEEDRWAYYVMEENRERYAMSAEEHLATMRSDGACHNA